MTFYACPCHTRVKVHRSLLGKNAQFRYLPESKESSFTTFDAQKRVQEWMMFCGSSHTMPLASTAWTETAAQQTTLLTYESNISDYLVLQKAVASYS